MNAPRFVFLLGNDRSGTNLLRLILDAHPDCVGSGPFHILSHVMKYFSPALDPRGEANWEGFLELLVHRAERSWSSADRSLDPERLAELASRREFGELYRALWTAEVGDSGARIVLVKEHRLHQHMAFLLAHFPDASFVHLVRDPRDVVTSYLTKGQKRPSRMIGRWREHQEEILRISHWMPRSRFFRLRYEDLVSTPEPVLHALCSFLGIELDPGMLKHQQTRRAARDGQRMKAITRRWLERSDQFEEGYRIVDLDEPITPAALGRYKEHLTWQQLFLIETDLGPLMEVFGYERSLPPPEANLGYEL